MFALLCCCLIAQLQLYILPMVHTPRTIVTPPPTITHEASVPDTFDLMPKNMMILSYFVLCDFNFVYLCAACVFLLISLEAQYGTCNGITTAIIAVALICARFHACVRAFACACARVCVYVCVCMCMCMCVCVLCGCVGCVFVLLCCCLIAQLHIPPMVHTPHSNVTRYSHHHTRSLCF